METNLQIHLLTTSVMSEATNTDFVLLLAGVAQVHGYTCKFTALQGLHIATSQNIELLAQL